MGRIDRVYFFVFAAAFFCCGCNADQEVRPIRNLSFFHKHFNTSSVYPTKNNGPYSPQYYSCVKTQRGYLVAEFRGVESYSKEVSRSLYVGSLLSR